MEIIILFVLGLVVMLLVQGAKETVDRIRDFDDPDKKLRLK